MGFIILSSCIFENIPNKNLFVFFKVQEGVIKDEKVHQEKAVSGRGTQDRKCQAERGQMPPEPRGVGVVPPYIPPGRGLSRQQTLPDGREDEPKQSEF